MMETNPYDVRRKPVRRQIVLDILDYTPIDIPERDLDTVAEEFEEVLRKRFDVKVDSIEVIQRVKE